MPVSAKRDTSPLHAAAIAIALLVIGFAGAWLYQRHAAALRSQVVYSAPSRVVAATSEYSVAASFAVITSGADIRWVNEHRRLLDDAVRQALTTHDARAALRPNGLLALQDTLRDAGNAALQTDKIRQVVITDFLVSSSSD